MIKNLTVKSRTRLFVIFTICTIVFLILVAPIMFNFKNFFEIGKYSVEDDFTNEYSDGTSGIHVVLTLQYEELENYILNADITPISSGDVVHHGLLSVHNIFLQNNTLRSESALTYDPPGDSFNDHTILNLALNEILKIRGQVEVRCFVNGTTLVNETISYEVLFVIPITRGDMDNIDLMIYALFITYFLFIPIFPFIFSFIFKPVFGVDFDDETQDKNKKFVHYMSEKAEEKRKENNNSGPK